MVLIWEEGGAGKTSLAFQIARWGFEGKLADHALLPVVLDCSTENGDLVDWVQRQLIHVDTTINRDFVRELVSRRRLLPIIDHFSELSDRQRKFLRDRLLPPHLVLLTSRLRETNFFSNWSVTEIQPQRLQGDALFEFFDAYLAAKRSDPGHRNAPATLSLEDQIRTKDLLERMVGTKPITVLLVCLVVDKALAFIADGCIELLPSSVPELMLAYVNRSFINITDQKPLLDDGTPLEPIGIQNKLKALALAVHRQNNNAYRPQDFHLSFAVNALSQIASDGKVVATEDHLRRLVKCFHEQLNLLQRVGGSDVNPTYRLTLDPLADYMAALGLIDELKGGRPADSLDDKSHCECVRDWLARLKGRLDRDAGNAGPLMSGFLAACRDGYKDLLKRAPSSLDPQLQKDWEEIQHTFACLAGIDPQQERELEVRQLIRRHKDDLFFSNDALLPKAIAELSAFAQEFAGGQELDPAIVPLACTMAKATLPEQVRAAAAEALGLIGGDKSSKALLRMIKNDREPRVAIRRAAVEALGLVECHQDAHWKLLNEILASEANHLGDEIDQDVIDAKLPLLQGAARGLQRLASRSLEASSQDSPQWVWGAGPGLPVPMLTLTTKAGAVTTRLLDDVEVWQLPLPGGIPLEVVAIPKGRFQMGSPALEEVRDAFGHLPETPPVDDEVLRWVQLKAFAIARTPISQAQWRAVANLDPVELPLKLDPAQNKGPEFPVECVSWYEAREWCARLNRYFCSDQDEPSAVVSLASEAQWEYACRAGSNTAFHFGDTIDAAWANYNAQYSYGRGKPGVHLNRTTPVGAYGLVNRWGLSDLHGNLWEWCEDRWHQTLEKGPTDGSSWLELAADLPQTFSLRRLLRGGSWYYHPGYCRSAYRIHFRPDHADNNVGFRVICKLQRSSLDH